VIPVLNFFAEGGLLKRVKRSGWWVLGMKNQESVAEHCFRCAMIGYVLAVMEQADAHTVTMMCLFNDIHEARINDAHKMAVRYLNYSEAEETAFQDQIGSLPEPIRGQMAAWRRDYTRQRSAESILARDADILECLVQAKEYYDQGLPQAKLFFKKAPGFLRSKSAKALWRQLQRWDSSQWWQHLTTFKR